MAQKIFTTDTWTEFTDNMSALSGKVKSTNIAYGTCSTAAATAAKVVTVSGNTNWKLVAGSMITVLFSATNTANNPTLNVNSTGAKNIYYGSSQITTSSLGYGGTANRPMTFVYDGTQYRFSGWGYDSNTTYTNVKLGHGYCTCSTAADTVAKTASLSSYTLTTGGIVAVKFTYDVPASATLNINSKGAKAIYHKGSAITAGVIKAGDTATFIYSTYYHLISLDRDTTYSAAGTSLGLVKSGGDVTISSGVITVNDDSHNHTIANVDNLQSSLDAKQATITGGASTITSSNLTASRALVSNGSGKVAVSDVTSTELGYLDGVTSNIQTQLDSKVGSDHTHSDYASKSLYDTRTINVGRKSDTNVGSYSLAFGADTQASANYTQAFGINSVASGFGAHAEGTNYRENNSVLSSRTVTVGDEEYTVTGTTAQGRASHAEGVQTFALGYASHSEGYTTTAGGEASHAEGYNTIASGNWSHSEGEDTVASAIHSHAEGYGTIASSIQQHVQGKYNIEDANGDYLHIVGNGGSETYRSNAHTLDWDGNAWFAGDVYVGSTSGTNKDSGSVKLATSSDLEEVRTAFQDGCDTLVAGCTTYGVQPESNSPADIVEAIAAIYAARYNAGVAATKVGTAVAANVLTGKTFTNASGVGLTGTMANQGAWTGATTGSGNVTIPAGYHNGSGYVSGSGAYNAGVSSGKTATNTYTLATEGRWVNESVDGKSISYSAAKGKYIFIGIYAGHHNSQETPAAFTISGGSQKNIYHKTVASGVMRSRVRITEVIMSSAGTISCTYQTGAAEHHYAFLYLGVVAVT